MKRLILPLLPATAGIVRPAQLNVAPAQRVIGVPVPPTVHYRMTTIDGVNMSYREAGPADALDHRPFRSGRTVRRNGALDPRLPRPETGAALIGTREKENDDDPPALPPFTHESAMEKVRLAEDGWNSRDPAGVAMAYSPDSRWRNRVEFFTGRDQIEAFLTRKWNREIDYRLIKELWAFAGNRIAVRYAYEYHDDSGQWFRAYGNENWEFDDGGLMRVRHSSINEHPIRQEDRRFHWPLGRRPDDHPGLSHFGF